MTEYPTLCRELSARIGRKLLPQPVERVHGGCISEAWRWEAKEGAPLFVKLAPLESLEALRCEAAGLETLRAAQAVRVPGVLAVGAAGERAFLALEWICFAHKSEVAHARFGEQLARLHASEARQFGWERANFIGSTPQENLPGTDWSNFFREHRLGFQLELAARNGYRGRLQRRGALLLERMHVFFEGHRPSASLLHGDLWAGNWGVDSEQQPVIFDPAVYYGDREADFAMTRLFGGFGSAFYEAYASAWAPADGSETRAVLYNLYHVLNHLNLFGTAYLQQAHEMLEQLLGELQA